MAMGRVFMRKRNIVVSAVSLGLAGAVSAAAFIAATSTGTGHAAQGAEHPTTETTVTVPTVEFGQTGTVTIKVKNTSAHVTVHPTTVTLGPLVVTPTGTNTCPPGSFTVGPVASALPVTLLAGVETTAATAPLKFVDLSAVDQTGCLGADVAISATVS